MRKQTAITAAVLLVQVVIAAAAENLDRGFIALQRDDGSVFLSWRLLEADPADIAFKVARTDGQTPGATRVWLTDRGPHGLIAADVDRDGRGELVIGAAVLDDTGKGLWSLEMGHPDICYVADVDPENPGLEVFYGFESRQKTDGMCVVAQTMAYYYPAQLGEPPQKDSR